ncbi:MAG TPA: nuclear transport factor 2 family protein [Rhizomicrobium sp.]|nr:nuclear transport factor 2 family protein [Rhizomicrobium sp.]
MSAEATRKLANDFLDAVERGDLETVQRIYAPDAVVWHNFDDIAQPVAENLRTLAQVVKLLPERRYEQRRINVFDGGFVEQHVLNGRLASGRAVSLAACLVCTVRDGRITRLDEYLDAAAIADWRN